MSINVAVLMPTYGRSDIIQDTLGACLNLYKKYNFDVFVFDSSGDEKTQNIVLDMQKTYDNLFYIRLPELIHLDCKWLYMIKGEYLKKKYHYIYPCGDAISLTEFVLNKINPYLQENVDLINMCDLNRVNTTTEFNSPNSFFNSNNSNTGQWGGAIYNYDKLFNLSDDEWNVATGKWFKKDLEYIGLNGFIYERISLCDNLRIIEPSMEGIEPSKVFRRSTYKHGSFWTQNSMKLLGETYPKVYSMLPECYTNKEEKIKQILYDYFDMKYFCCLKKNYRFTLIEYFSHKKFFDRKKIKIMNIKILILALLPKWLLISLFDNEMLRKQMLKYAKI